MAKNLDKDPFTYQKEGESFLKDLHRFHVSRGTSYTSFPCISGHEVDLYLLYNKVTQLGGWVKVTDEQRWEEIQELFHVPLACTNSAVALKQVYIRYLSHYEKAHHFGEDPDRIRDDQMDDKTLQARKKATGPIGGVPLHYNYGQHQMPDHMRRSMGLKITKDLSSTGEYQNLEHALMSGLPNEVDFALNVCTLLSNEGRHTIQLDKCPHLLKFMFAHIGIYEQDYEAMYKLHETGWRKYTKTSYSRFWYDSVRDKEIRKYLVPGSLELPKSPKSLSQCPSSPESSSEEGVDGVSSVLSDLQSNEPSTSADTYQSSSSRLLDDDQDDDVLALDRQLGMYDKEGQRVLQLAMIVRNLSFEKKNMEIMAKDLATFRFLLLCIHNKYNTLRQLALDTLSNIALRMVLRPIRQPATQLVFQIIAQCIASDDKFQVVSGLDMLARFCQVDANEDLICDNLEDKVYEDIVRLLTVQDIQLIVYTLEVLYQLSELGEVTTTHIAAIRMAVETLVNLVTVEAQSYGPDSLIGIKVVEHVTTIPVSGEQVAPPSQATIQQQMATPQPATPIQTANVPARPPQPSTSQTTSTPVRPRPQVPIKCPTAAPTPPPRPVLVPTPPPSTPSAAALTMAAQQSMMPQTEMDSDTLACNWLMAHYDLVVGAETDDIPKMELYGEFLSTCGRLFIKNIASANSFANCVRMTFPKVENMKVKRPDGTWEHTYRGLVCKAVPLPFPPNTDVTTPMRGLQRVPTPTMAVPQSPTPVGVASPNTQPGNVSTSHQPPQPISMVTQANLPGSQITSTPPISPNKFSQQISPNTFPTIQHALLSGQVASPQSPQQNVQPANSTLIKSLLANKVTQNLNRQQQQTPSDQTFMNHAVVQSQPQQWTGQPEQPFQSYQGYPQQVMNQQAPAQEPGAPPFTTLQQSSQHTPSVQSSPNSKAKRIRAVTTTPPGTPTNKPKPRNRSPRNRNNGRETVFTDIKIMEDLIEKVARQGSMDSDDEGSSQVDNVDITIDKPDTPLMPLEGVAEDPIMAMSPAPGELIEGVDSNHGVLASGDRDTITTITTKSSCDIQQKDNNTSGSALPTVNGTTMETVLNGSSNHDQSHHASGDAGSNHSSIEKTKSQLPLMNGAMHHLGNGNCNKALKSKDLAALNNKICSSTVTLNSQTKGTHPVENSVDSGIMKCDNANVGCEAKEPSKPVIENGYTSTADDENYKMPQLDGTLDDEDYRMPQLDGTLDDEDAMETENAVQQLTAIQESMAPPVAEEPGPSVQMSPTQIMYQPGLQIPEQPTLIPQDPISQPQLTEPNAEPQVGLQQSGHPQVGQSQIGQPPAGQSQVGQPQVGQPQMGQPQSVQGQPQSIQGQTYFVQGQPQMIQGQPQFVQGQQPQVIPGQTQVVQGQPQVVQGQPQVVQGQPQIVQSQTQLVQGQTQVVQQGLPQQIAAPPVVQHPVATAQSSAPVAGQPAQPQTFMQQVVNQPGQPPQIIQQAVVNNPIQLQQQQQHLQLQQQQLQMQLQQLQQMQQQIQQQFIQTQHAQQQLGVSGSQTVTTQANQAYILPKPGMASAPQVVASDQASAGVSQASQISPNQQQALILPKPVPGQTAQQQVQMLLRPPQSGQATVSYPAGQPGQPLTTMVRLPLSVPQQVGLNQGQAGQTLVTQAQSQPQLSVQTTRFVMPQGKMAVCQQTGISQTAGQPVLVQQTPTGQTQVLQQQIHRPMIQSQVSMAQTGQVRTQLVQAPRLVTAQGQTQYIQPRQLIHHVPGKPAPGQNMIVSQACQITPPQILRMPGQAAPQTTQKMITTQAQYLQTGQMIATSMPQLGHQTTTSGVTIQYQPTGGPQQQMIQKQLVSGHAGSVGGQTVSAPTIQIPASQITMPNLSSYSPAPLTINVTPSPISTPPPPSPLSSKASQPSPTTVPTSSKKKRPAATPTADKSSKKKKTASSSSKSRSSSTDSRPPSRTGSQPSPALPPANQNKYCCEWAGCKQWFDTIKVFNKHVIKEHFEKQYQQAVCRWHGCDNLHRPKWSLMTHLQDRHMNDSSFKNPATLAAKKPEPVQPPPPPAPKPAVVPTPPAKPAGPGVPPVYPENAALQAIRRFAARPPYAEFVEMKEGPVTKHIRLTSALILRNLARFSSLGRSQLKRHEDHLAFVALSSVEASGPISNCLWELHQTDPS